MYCSKCGAHLSEGAKKCDKCGAPVRARAASASEKRKEIALDYAPRNLGEEQDDSGKNKDSLNQDIFNIKDDSGSRLYYGAVTPMEKVRRRIMEVRHSMEETREENRMRRHMERAEKHYEAIGAPKTPILKKSEPAKVKGSENRSVNPAPSKKRAGSSASSGAANSAAIEAQIAKEREKKVRLEQDRLEREKKIRAEQNARDLAAQKAGARNAAEQTTRADQEAIAVANRILKGEKIADFDESAQDIHAGGDAFEERFNAGRDASEESFHAGRDASEESFSAGRDVSEESFNAGRDASEESADAGQEDIAIATQVLSEERAGAERAALADQKDAEERARAAREEAARREALILKEKREREERARALSERVISEEEKQVREARRIRRYYEEEPDAFELFLGKFGLSKEAGVRLATLFLVVILTIIYVIGRGKAPKPDGSPQAGEGMTGDQFSSAPSYGSTDGGSLFDNSDLPIGGGDFQNSDSASEIQQEGPDTQEPTDELEEPAEESTEQAE